jgi:hypothetical protein
MKRLNIVREFLFWAAILTVLPGCDQLFGLDRVTPDATTPDAGFNLVRGPLPRTGVVFCDIEEARRCATASDKAEGIRLAEAATALLEGRSSNIALDDSPAALSRCGGEPEAVVMNGPFPQGLPICLNCGEVLGPGKVNPDAATVCQAQCWDMVLGPPAENGAATPVVPPSAGTIVACSQKARVSVNGLTDMCFADACTDTGMLLPGYFDPRRQSEAVNWTDFIGTEPGGSGPNSLTRTAGGTNLFDAGAVSAEWFTRGDAWVEFSLDRADGEAFVGLSEVPSGCGACTDNDGGNGNINYAVYFRADGQIGLYESGTGITPPNGDPSFGPYAAGERFRIRLRDLGNGRATVRFTRLIGICVPGGICNEQELHVSSRQASYPLRVDTSLRSSGLTVTDVRIARIK